MKNMTPNLFHIHYQRLFQLLITIAALSLIGADNSDDETFINKTSPDHAILSAPHAHSPDQAKAERFPDRSAHTDKIFQPEKIDFKESERAYGRSKWPDELFPDNHVTGDDYARQALPRRGRSVSGS